MNAEHVHAHPDHSHDPSHAHRHDSQHPSAMIAVAPRISLMRLSLLQRAAIAGLAIAAIWAAVLASVQ